MEFVHVSINDGIAETTLKRGKVNALNEPAVEEIADCLRSLAADPDVKAVILTGDGPFFSFGFDIPEFLGYSRESFAKFLHRFTGLYSYLFTYHKPVVAALNGHAIAGGCMLALACDYRIMVLGKAKIALNEISFGSSVFAGSVAMLKFLVGGKNAQAILYDAMMYSAETAAQLGMIDKVSSSDSLMKDAREVHSAWRGKMQPLLAALRTSCEHLWRRIWQETRRDLCRNLSAFGIPRVPGQISAALQSIPSWFRLN